MTKKSMFLAALMGSAMFAASALAAGADLSLATAAKQGDSAAVQTLLNGRGKQSVSGPDGTAALVWAATRNDMQMAELLMRAGANVRAPNEFGATAIYAAAEHSDPALVKKLLAAKADPNIALPSGETPLMTAASRGNLETVRALLQGGANPNAKENNGGHTALMFALSEKHADVVAALVKGGADVNLGAKSGFTPLMFAAQQNDVDSGSILVKAGAKPNMAQPGSGTTPLLIATAMSSVKSVDFLLENGANPNAADSNGYAPLHKAVRDSDYGIATENKDAILQVVKSLLKHGANPNQRIAQDKAKAAEEIKRGANAFEGRRTALTVTEVLLQGSTPVLLAAEVNNLDVIKALVEAGADPNIPTESGTTALIMAAGAGTDVQRMRDDDERAISVQTAQFLLDHGADVNKGGQFGWTALHAATYQGINPLIETLVSRGAKVDQKDDFGQTALSISMSVLTKEIGDRRLQIPRRYRPDTARLLLKLGATPLDKSGVNVVLQRSGDENLSANP
jgi:ankyrin repeat protein